MRYAAANSVRAGAGGRAGHAPLARTGVDCEAHVAPSFPRRQLRRAAAAFENVTFVALLLHVGVLVYMLMQPDDQREATLHKLFGSIGAGPGSAEKGEYGVMCDITNFKHVVANLDIYYMEHFFGWVVGGFALRSMGSAFLYSIAWEMIEWEFQYVFRVFQECWWDKVILDGLCGNGLGIVIGATLSKRLGVARYEWLVQGHYLRSFIFLVGNYSTFAYGSLVMYAFNDAVDIPEFHPFTFYFLGGSAAMLYFTYVEHYEHFSFKRFGFKWRPLTFTAVTTAAATAWKYGLRDYQCVMPEQWLEGIVATFAFYVLLFLINISFRRLPDPKVIWPHYRKRVQ